MAGIEMALNININAPAGGVDIATVLYDVELITETGARYVLNEALLTLEWEEQISELAQRANITLANIQAGSSRLSALCKINCIIQIFAKWNGGARKLMLDGTIWEWQYTSATEKELAITVYDNLIRLQQSKDIKYFSKGMQTPDLISAICSDWGVESDYQWDQKLTHEKKTFSAVPISDMIVGLLEEVRKKTAKKYVMLFKDGKLTIAGFGSNSEIYLFDETNSIQTLNKLTANNLVTRVKVIGKEDKKGRSSVDAVVDGDTKYGVLQEIVRRDSNKKMKDAMDEANALIKERGTPQELIQTQVPDLPFLRKGDKIEMAAGNLMGFFFVESVVHVATDRRMTLTLTRDKGDEGEGESGDATVNKGDSSPEVAEMQELLEKHGQSLPIFGSDGIFGNETQRAVKEFQKSVGLEPDGICGPDTWAALRG